MTELAHYKQGYGRLPGFVAGSSIFVITTALMSAGINLWLHNLWMAGLNLFTAVGFLPTLFVQGIIYLNVRWKRPAVWIQDETLYAITPTHFRIPIDDIAAWQVTGRFGLIRYYTFVLLTDHKGKTRRIGIDFVADRDRLIANFETLLGPQTHQAAADATARTTLAGKT